MGMRTANETWGMEDWKCRMEFWIFKWGMGSNRMRARNGVVENDICGKRGVAHSDLKVVREATKVK